METSSHQLLFLSRADIEETGIAMKEIVSAVEQAFREKGEGHTEMPPKPGIHPAADAFIHAMPAFLRSVLILLIVDIHVELGGGFPQSPTVIQPLVQA
jgi:ornithine cyclodeaminase/alanine dehydrogenase-like protein (mu-crystallin family)